MNQDSLGNPAQEMRAGLRARVRARGDRVVIDRCNHDRAQRAHWTRILERAAAVAKSRSG